MVDYHLMAEAIQFGWGLGGAVQGSVLIITNINNIFGVSYKITIKSQPQVLIKWFLIKKQRVYQTYDMKYLKAVGN